MGDPFLPNRDETLFQTFLTKVAELKIEPMMVVTDAAIINNLQLQS